MKVLVTAGNTLTPIDRVRCLTNIFSGRTGAAIAVTAHVRRHDVCLLTSHPEVLRDLAPDLRSDDPSWQVHPYRTFADLRDLMAEQVARGGYDVVIHAAAVGDFELGGVYTPSAGTTFDAQGQVWHAAGGAPRLTDAGAGKVKSHHRELWLRLVPAPKLVDLIRSDWGFRGVLVKFKLEVGASDSDLLAIAERSRQQSAADLMVANTLEGMHAHAYIGTAAGHYERVERPHLPDALLHRVEAIHAARTA